MSRAYSLSYLLLAGDADNAQQVVITSLDEWNADWAVQKHRAYYKPRSNKQRNKIILSRPVLLQYIVCKQTISYEKAQEAAFLKGQGSLAVRTLMLRFVKHMLHESFSRSFYMVVGICRVLHKYDHATTKRIYGVVEQRDQDRLVDSDPNNKTDDDYRRWKMVLVDSLEQRFAPFVSIYYGPRNEKRFVSNAPCSEWYEYIKECLALLTPWETEHILPPEFEPAKFNIVALKFEGKYRDEWHPIEENRMHIIIDPDCFFRLTNACQASAPEQQLDVPQFKSVGRDQDSDSANKMDKPPDLTVGQFKTISDELERRGMRRKAAVAPSLSIEVDGVVCARLHTADTHSVRLELEPESKQIQVFMRDDEGKLLLASLWLSMVNMTHDAGWSSSILLEGGQKLAITLNPLVSTTGQVERLIAQVTYREGNQLRLLARRCYQYRDRLSENSQRLYQSCFIHKMSGYQALISLLCIISIIAPLTYHLFTARQNVKPNIKIGRQLAGPMNAETGTDEDGLSTNSYWSAGRDTSGGVAASPVQTNTNAPRSLALPFNMVAPLRVFPAPFPGEQPSLSRQFNFRAPDLSRVAAAGTQNLSETAALPFTLNGAGALSLPKPDAGIDVGNLLTYSQPHSKMLPLAPAFSLSNSSSEASGLALNQVRTADDTVPRSGFGFNLPMRTAQRGAYGIAALPVDSARQAWSLREAVTPSLDFAYKLKSGTKYRGVDSGWTQNAVGPPDFIGNAPSLANRAQQTARAFQFDNRRYFTGGPLDNRQYGGSEGASAFNRQLFVIADLNAHQGQVSLHLPSSRFTTDSARPANQPEYRVSPAGVLTPGTFRDDLRLNEFVKGWKAPSAETNYGAGWNLERNNFLVASLNVFDPLPEGGRRPIEPKQGQHRRTIFLPYNQAWRDMRNLPPIHLAGHDGGRRELWSAGRDNSDERQFEFTIRLDFGDEPEKRKQDVATGMWDSAATRPPDQDSSTSEPNNSTAGTVPLAPPQFPRARRVPGQQPSTGCRDQRTPAESSHKPFAVSLSANRSAVQLAASCSSTQVAAGGCKPTSTSVRLSATTTAQNADKLSHIWSATGGHIKDDGSNATWDLAGVAPGIYTASIMVVDVCGGIAYSKISVAVESCSKCNGGPSLPPPSLLEFQFEAWLTPLASSPAL